MPPYTKETEDTIERERIVYRALFEQTNDAVFLLDLTGKHLRANRRAQEILGYSKEEILEMSFRDTVETSELEDSKLRLEMLLQGKTLPIYERTVIRKDGTRIPVEFNVALVRDSKGEPLYIQSIMRDITNRKDREQELSKFSRAVESSPASIVITNAAGDIEYVNPMFTELTGYSAEEAIGKNPSVLKSGWTPESLYEELWQTILSGEVWHGEFVNQKKNGDIYFEDARIAPIFDSKGNITHYVAVKVDISKRRQVQESLEISEKRNRELIENMPEGMALVSLEEDILFANQAFADMLRIPMEKLTSMNLLDLVDPEEMEKIRSQTTLRQTGSASTYELTVVRGDGEKRTLRVSAVPWLGDTGIISGAIAVTVDITERSKMETALRESERAQRASARDLELYTSILKHDLSNDLQIILTQSEMASLLFTPDSPELECCRTSMGAAERMANLLRFLGTGEFQPRTPLTEVLAKTISQGRITYPKMKIVLKAEKNAKDLVVAGGRLLDALFANMLRNTSQHAGEKPEVTITVKEAGDFAQITFSDNGPGVASEIRGNLFQKGVSTEGRGQGLYLCKRITEAYGGKIALEDADETAGASFRIMLPLANGA
jgi:PAS domain S-box-containing protein